MKLTILIIAVALSGCAQQPQRQCLRTEPMTVTIPFSGPAGTMLISRQVEACVEWAQY